MLCWEGDVPGQTRTTMRSNLLESAVELLLAVVATSWAQAQTFATLHSFKR